MSKILTSHVGSLPRSQDVVDYIFARENNQQFDLELILLVMVKHQKYLMQPMLKIGMKVSLEIALEMHQKI